MLARLKRLLAALPLPNLGSLWQSLRARLATLHLPDLRRVIANLGAGLGRLRQLDLRYRAPADFLGPVVAGAINALALILLGATAATGAQGALPVIGALAGVLALAVAYWLSRRAARQPWPNAIDVLPISTAAVGMFSLLSQLMALILMTLRLPELIGVANVLGWPAFLAWIVGGAVNGYENLAVLPKNGRALIGMLESLCQVPAALLIWVYLILLLSHRLILQYDPASFSWLYDLGMRLALLGILFGLAVAAWHLPEKT